ncbi:MULTISPECIES: C4-dicarboxylate transporter DctA [Pseudomonas fluorescens group]|uniref:C4-dicarboxylate transport protein n=3 Tax=Pseudomonas fluorescens group TaxID=136843 RepID=A0A3M3WP79_PSEMA|nr:C4-dicarboxylate transporter DctA [Pseudomonas marginalis]MCD7037120.1 C4-dicarboxylate transporter DctA [Pseudomonas petroselini]MCD7044589.1 C4-dicarboxylate transporter DctA [Pseudomonas petroselini]MCD7070286.1 C4-dicarboxylate transporter DctA [Pseudomonas petroselini]MCD7080401.1 C4-dicarboxylate transporter DctA [Pseudomonas petroselini]OAJ48966.1 C4-dicarboxylate transporter [Pseudomonas marginalis]
MEMSKSRWYSQLYVQVLIGIVIGAAIGHFEPQFGAKLQPFADGFIKLIKMLLAPIIFGTVVVGIAKMGSIKEVGRIGVKALLYFEILSTVALVLGLIVVNVVKPGAGMNINATTLDASAIAKYSQAASDQGGTIDFFLNIIPSTFIGAFSNGVMLQVILISVLMGIALVQMGETSKPLINTIDLFLQGLFKIVAMVMRLAPIGAGAGMAFTIGKYGIGTLLSLGQLLVALYITTLIFIVVVLGTVARWSGMPLMPFLRYFKDEILITLGTCSTEAVLPRMMVKLEKLGCKKSVVGMVLPTGYAFNADGTCIYLTMAAIFIAQATNTPLTFMDQMILLGVFLLTSKGSAGVAGAGFITLAATLTTIHSIPLVGLVLLLGIDRFLNEARAVTNLIGNGIGTIAIAKWDNSFDVEACEREIAAMKHEKAARKALLPQK